MKKFVLILGLLAGLTIATSVAFAQQPTTQPTITSVDGHYHQRLWHG